MLMLWTRDALSSPILSKKISNEAGQRGGKVCEAEKLNEFFE
jgi:hypothetical protein